MRSRALVTAAVLFSFVSLLGMTTAQTSTSRVFVLLIDQLTWEDLLENLPRPFPSYT